MKRQIILETLDGALKVIRLTPFTPLESLGIMIKELRLPVVQYDSLNAVLIAKVRYGGFIRQMSSKNAYFFLVLKVPSFSCVHGHVLLRSV